MKILTDRLISKINIQNFHPRLLDHLYARCQGLDYDGDEMSFPEERNQIIIKNEKIFTHQRLRVNYTTYDLQRDYDTINPTSNRPYVMVLSREDNGLSPFWYAQVLGIYHANVIYKKQSPYPKRMDFLFVRWLGRDPDWEFGDAVRRLERIGFVEESDPGAFGFLDPDLIVRGAHLIPAFAHGRTRKLLGISKLARLQDGRDDDWEYFYVNK